jgi:outer membrane protein assembly factor BamA
LRQDARRDFHARTAGSEWKDLYGEGEVLAYVKPPVFPNHTLVLRAAGAGGWTTTTPFQLTLGGDRALRGYDPERLPGGRRMVFTAEDRYYFGWPFKEVFDLGGSAFVDLGRIWPGDVPYGVDSGWRASGGVGLRGSFPAGSHNTYRADIAFPIVSGASLRDVRFILSIGEILGLTSSFGDPQIYRSRQAGVSGELFSFPN